MAKKQFYATISLANPEKLSKTVYVPEFRKDFVPEAATAPAIAMIEMYLKPEDDYEIVAIITDDENGWSAKNFESFTKELDALSEKIGAKLTVNKEIHIPYEESKAKHVEVFRTICDSFEPVSEVYMDVTYGSKITSISQFSSLVYAEKVVKSQIKDVVYGQFFHDGSNRGRLFSVRCLYELKELIQSAAAADNIDIDELLDKFEGAVYE